MAVLKEIFLLSTETFPVDNVRAEVFINLAPFTFIPFSLAITRSALFPKTSSPPFNSEAEFP